MVAPLFKNSAIYIPSVTQKTLAMTFLAEVCTLNLFALIPIQQPRLPVFLARCSMLSEGAVLRTTTS